MALKLNLYIWMREDNIHIKGLNDGGHLDENSIAAAAEWLKSKHGDLDDLIKEHLENCMQCKQAVLEVSEFEIEKTSYNNEGADIKDKFEETCAAKYSPSIRSSKSTQLWRVAAIFLLLISVTALTLLVRPKKEETFVNNYEKTDSLNRDTDIKEEDLTRSTEDSLKNQTIKAPIQIESVEEDLFAQNFVPNPGYEALIGAQFRAGVLPSIIMPGKDTFLIQGEVLSFHGNNPTNEILELQILDNKGFLIKTFLGLDSVNFDLKFEFDPGLYYWKLLGEDELHQVGKILLNDPGK